MTYIHYGSDHFDPALFDPVRNGGLEYGFRPKPADGTGLWARTTNLLLFGGTYDGN